MAASKLKSRRRFITRDVRLDIPEDQELTISPLDDATSQQDCHSPYTFTADTPYYDRTWPRRNWRPSSDFARPCGLQQNSVVNSTLTLPRFHHAVEESRSGHFGLLHAPPPSDRYGSGSASPTSSSSDTRWHFRSPSDAVSSSNSISAVPSPSDTVSEPCFKTTCHDGSIYDIGSLSSRNSNVSSPRDPATTFALGSIPELADDDDISISGLETKRRSYSLNDSSSRRPFFSQPRSSRSPQPGSVLHRALTWEMAGKSQPFRVTVSPINDSKGQESGFRRNASNGKLQVVQPHHVFDPSTVRSSSTEISNAWKSMDPTTMSWTKQDEGMAINSNSAWKRVDSATQSWTKQEEGISGNSSSCWKSVDPVAKLWSKQGEGMTVNSNSAWKNADPASQSWTKLEERLAANSNSVWRSVDPAAKSSSVKQEEHAAVIDQDREIRLSPFSTSSNDSRHEPKTKQTTWNFAGKQSQQCPEMICKKLSNGFHLERPEQDAAGCNDKGFRAQEFRTSTRVAGVKASRSFSGSTENRKGIEKVFVGSQNTFRDNHVDDLNSSKDFLCAPLAEKPINGESHHRDNDGCNASCDDPIIATCRKPFRSKSLKLLSSESTGFALEKNSRFLRPLSDWKTTDTVSLSTPTSPLSLPVEIETATKHPATHPLTQPYLSMIALNTEPKELCLRSNSLTQSATSLVGNPAMQNRLSTWGPFVVKDLRKAIASKPMASTLTSIGGQMKPDGIKPFASNFVVRRITNLAKNPFNSISTSGEYKTGGINLDQCLSTTKSLNNEYDASLVKSFNAEQVAKEDRLGQTPSPLRLEMERSKYDPTGGAAPALNIHDIYALDQNNEPWSQIPAWNDAAHTTRQDEVGPLSNCDSLASSKDTGYGRSASESSPTVTSERLTVHLSEPIDPSLIVDENRDADMCNGSSALFGRNTKRTSGEPCSRHIRVFLKSSTQLQDEACASHPDKTVAKAAAGSQNIYSKWKTDVSKTQLDNGPSSDRCLEARSETKDAKLKGSSEIKDPFEAKYPVCLTATFSPTASHSEHWPRKANANQNPPLSENGVSCLKGQEKQKEESPPFYWDARGSSPTSRPASAGNRYHHAETQGTDAGPKKTFEIVKKKLIIPEAMSWFGSNDDKSKSGWKQDLAHSQKGEDLPASTGRDICGFQREQKHSDRVKLLLSTVRKETEVSQKKVKPVNGTVEHNINGSVKAGTRSYIANGPLLDDAKTFCGRPLQPKRNALENISVAPPNQTITFDTGISICEGISSNGEIRKVATAAVDIGKRGFEKSVKELHEAVEPSQQPDESLCFLSSWTDAEKGGKPNETTAVDFLSNAKTLVNSTPLSSLVLEDKETDEFQTSIDCSIMTELDQAIEMLTATRPLQTKISPPDLQPATRVANEPVSLDGLMAPWEDISRKLTRAFSDQVNRKTPASIKVSSVQEDKARVAVSTALSMSEQKPVVPFSSIQTSCRPIAPIPVLRLNQNDVVGRVTAPPDKRNHHWGMILARDDSFNRPDSPLFRKTLPLPKDSVIMRHRLHQKELGCGVGGGSGTGYRSSSESSDDESPAQRVAPRRTKKLRSLSLDKGVVGGGGGIEEATEEEDDRNGERDSIVSSTSSLRPVSLDSSFLSEDNM